MKRDYLEYNTARQAEHSGLIGPSSVNACIKQLAYKYLEVSPSNVVDTGAADLGTLWHLGWSALIRSRYLPEERDCDVEIDWGGPRTGSADDVDYVNKRVLDLKSTSARSFQWWINHGVPEGYWDQLSLYAHGLRMKYGGEWEMVVLAIARDNMETGIDTGQMQEFTRAFDPEHGQALVDKANARHARLMAARNLLGVGEPLDIVDTFEREGRGPGSFPCDWCGFRSLCWPVVPEGSDMTPQSMTASGDDHAIGAFALEYMEAAADESKAKARKQDAAAFLRGLDGEYPGPDGNTYKITMVGGNPKDAVPDCAAMQEALDELGMQVPMKSGGVTPRYPRINRKGRK